MMCSVFVSALAFIGAAIAYPTKNPTATISSGPVVGTVTSLPTGGVSVHQYLGIPFAASPPVRFAPPQDPEAWTEPLFAQGFKSACIQQINYVPPHGKQAYDRLYAFQDNPPIVESEDCLYINVFTPAIAAPTGGRDVLVWIYGGTLQTGGANWPPYDGTVFAANQDIVFVTFNYRLGPFGFPNSLEIPINQQNTGFLDQRKALKWVQQNIRAFGGDPERVTIFGASAGGLSRDSTPEPIPFRAAIIESFPQLPGTGNGTLAWESLVEKTNCSNADSPLQCVSGLPASTIKDISEHNNLNFDPFPDNITYATDARPYFENGDAANVPIIIGSNADEGSLFAWVGGLDNPNINITNAIEKYYPGQPQQQHAILDAYSAALDDPYGFFIRYEGDTSFQCPLAGFTDLLIDTNYTSWRYLYNATFPNLNIFPRSGAYHYSEIPLIFGTFPSVNATMDQRVMSKYLQNTWADFAKDPRAGPGWMKLGDAEKDVEVIGYGGNNTARRRVSRQELDSICSIYPYIMNGPL